MAVKSVRGLESAMDGWTMYLTRDMITVVHEGALAVIVGKLRQEKKSYITSQLITELISSSDLDFPLKELSLLRKNESLSDIRFNQLYERIESKINSKKSLVRGLYRWEESINENDIIDLAFSCTDSSVLSLLPVAWIITELRCRDTLRSSDDKFDFLSYKGFARFGLKDIMIPLLDNWHKNNPPLLDIIYELTLRTISQHLRIVLTRMSVDFKRDTAVLNADGEYLHFRKEFLLRRTISRLRQLSSWLVQLGLINNDGITAYGNRILNRTLTTLAEKGIKE
jgi:hypothetical protein